MEPLDEAPIPQREASLPFGLRVFIVFASALCGGAGFALTLWALPTVAPKSIVSTVVHDTQEAVSTILDTSHNPCTPRTFEPEKPCEEDSDGETDHPGGLEKKKEGLVDSTTRNDVRVPVVTDEGKIVLDSGKTMLVEKAGLPVQKPVEKPAAKPKAQPQQKPVQQPVKTQEAPKQQATQPTPQPITVQETVVHAPVQQCTRMQSYLPASSLPMNPNGPAFQLTIDDAKYYTVFGRSAQEIRRQMAQCSPIEGGFDAVTHWWYRYAYSYYQNDSGLCEVRDVTLVLHITFLFPYWKDEGLNQQLTAHWNRYFTSLTTHENGHRDITLRYAQQALSAIQAFPPSSCVNIVQTVNAYADAQLDVIQQKNSAYDAETGHGETQGAVFP